MIRKTQFSVNPDQIGVNPGQSRWDREQVRVDQPTQPIRAIPGKQETEQERMKRLKQTADRTGRHLIHLYLEDERKRQVRGR